MTTEQWEDACDRGDSVRFVLPWNMPYARAALELVRAIEEDRFLSLRGPWDDLCPPSNPEIT